jgi:histidyl-tRNA synthetase
MADAGWLQTRATVAPVLVVNFQSADWSRYVQIAAELRAAGIGSEIYPDSKPLRDQFGYASSRGHRVAVIAGPDELASNTFALRDMSTRQQQKALPLAELVAKVRAAIG